MKEKEFTAGIDIGSTTVKLVILDDQGSLVFGQYRRHCAHTQETLAELLREAEQVLGADAILRVKITGSGGINLGKALDIAFVQEVVAVAAALQKAWYCASSANRGSRRLISKAISTPESSAAIRS